MSRHAPAVRPDVDRVKEGGRRVHDLDARQVEGMVVDTATGTLYAGQEDVGTWRLPRWARGALGDGRS